MHEPQKGTTNSDSRGNRLKLGRQLKRDPARGVDIAKCAAAQVEQDAADNSDERSPGNRDGRTPRLGSGADREGPQWCEAERHHHQAHDPASDGIGNQDLDHGAVIVIGRVSPRHGGPSPGPSCPLSGHLFCGRCASRMAGRSGTGRLGATYFYYACLNKDCGLRVVASEIEGAVLDRVALLANSPEIVNALCTESNRRRERRLPALQKQLRAQQRSLANVRTQAARLLGRDDPSDASAARSFVDNQLSALARQRDELESAILETEAALRDLQAAAVDADTARTGLANFRRVYECLRPFEKQELIRLVLHRAEVGDHEIVLEIFEGACASFAQAPKSDSRFEPTIWPRHLFRSNHSQPASTCQGSLRRDPLFYLIVRKAGEVVRFSDRAFTIASQRAYSLTEGGSARGWTLKALPKPDAGISSDGPTGRFAMNYPIAENNNLLPPEGPDMDLLRDRYFDFVIDSIPKIAERMAEVVNDLPHGVVTVAWDALISGQEHALTRMNAEEVALFGVYYGIIPDFEGWLAHGIKP